MDRLNYLTNIKALMAAWSDRFHEANTDAGKMTHGKLGHINIEGEPESRAHTYSRYNPLFVQSLEPGIRALVIAIINRMDCLTYSSCQGHTNDDGSEVASLRNVGFLPRSEKEKTWLTADLNDLIARAEEDWSGTVRLVLLSNKLESDGKLLDVLDLVFSAEMPPDQYFAEADALASRLVDLLAADEMTAR
jgi:hypothetical protein